MKYCIVVIFFLFCSTEIYCQAASPKMEPEDEIRLAVFTDILPSWAGRHDEDIYGYYIGVDQNKDPGKTLLLRLREIDERLRPTSECFIDQGDGGTVKDVETGKRGVMFTVSKIKWIDADTAEVEAGSYLGNMGADGCVYRLARKDDSWKIVSRKDCYVS